MRSLDKRNCEWKDNIKTDVKEMSVRVWREALAALRAGIMQINVPRSL
jgi:hypothetical protein